MVVQKARKKENIYGRKIPVYTGMTVQARINETPRRKQRGICLTDGLTRQLEYFRPKGRGINLTRLKI